MKLGEYVVTADEFDYQQIDFAQELYAQFGHSKELLQDHLEGIGLTLIDQDNAKIGEVRSFLTPDSGMIWVKILGFRNDYVRVDAGPFGICETYSFFSLLKTRHIHSPVNNGMLKSWCQECNADMIFNRVKGIYE